MLNFRKFYLSKSHYETEVLFNRTHNVTHNNLFMDRIYLISLLLSSYFYPLIKIIGKASVIAISAKTS